MENEKKTLEIVEVGVPLTVNEETAKDYQFLLPFGRQQEGGDLNCSLWVRGDNQHTINVTSKDEAIISCISTVIQYEKNYNKLVNEYNGIAMALESVLQEMEDAGIESKSLKSNQEK